MTTMVGDSIRNKIGKPKIKNSGQAADTEKTVGQPINGSADEP
jgi:hypothetical protein